MSEYNANDHLHNVTASVQQLTYQAQGVQDITGANVADYEEIAPNAAASVTLVNARPGVPYLSVINSLPHLAQEGEGDPALDNPRPLKKYGKIHIYNGEENPLEIDLGEFYEGNVDILNGVANEKIIRYRVLTEQLTNDSTMTDAFYYVPDVPPYIGSPIGSRYIVCENYSALVGTRATMGLADSTFPENTIGILASGAEVTQPRIYIRLAENGTADDIIAFLAEKPIYVYYRIVTPIAKPITLNRLYVPAPDADISAEYGTLTVKYQGIAPDEP